MADGRMLKKRISKSKKLAELKTNAARLLYLMIYSHLDVKGRHEADPCIIKGQIVPYLRSFTLAKIQAHLEDIAQVGLILLYCVNEEQFLQVTRFEDFQRLDPEREAKSVIPEPPPELLQSKSRPAPVQSKLSKVNISKDKEKHKDFVLLTPQEYSKLVARYGKSVISRYIEKLNNYVGSRGRKYKSHYHTILSWLGKDNIREVPSSVSLPEQKVDPKERHKIADLVHKTVKKMK